MNIKATQLRAGHRIMERSEKGKPLPHFPVIVEYVEPGCSIHVHVKLDDRRNWCYDAAAEVEVVR